MKVLMIVGSPHQKGCTYTALTEVASALNEEGIVTDYFWIGNKPIGGCIGCYQCVKKQKCIFDDKVNEFTNLAAEYDGFIFGSPVYYSGMNGSLMSFMDRVFYSASGNSTSRMTLFQLSCHVLIFFIDCSPAHFRSTHCLEL